MENEEETQEVVTPTEPEVDIVAKTNEAAARLERANAELKATMAQHKALKIEETLGGTAAAGKPPEKDSAEDYAEKALSGELNEN